MKFKNIVAIAFTASMVFSCNFLDIVPDNIATVDLAFNSRANAIKYLSTCYSYLPNFGDNAQNPALSAGDEITTFDPPRDWGGSTAGLLIAKGQQNANEPYLNFWNGLNAGLPLFRGIRDCNTFLDNIGKVRDLEEYERNIWIAEVKVLKAYYHFYLMQLYGPVPIIDQNLAVYTPVEETKIERRPVDDVVNYVVQLIDEAMPDLQFTLQDEYMERGRMTQPIAKAIKAKVLMTAASPLFNGNVDYSGFLDKNGVELINTTFDATKWQRAADAVKEAIDAAEAKGHKLYYFVVPANFSNTSPETIKKMDLRGSVSEPWNEEIVWGAAHSTANNIQNVSFARIDPANVLNERARGLYAPTMKMAELFYTKRGVPITEDKFWNYGNRFQLRTALATEPADQGTPAVPWQSTRYIRTGHTTAQLHFEREPRFYSSLGFDGGIWEGQKSTYNDNSPFFVDGLARKTAARTGVSNYSITGYYPKKLVNYMDIIGSGSSTITIIQYPWPVIRLADLYLMHAEALNEVNGPTAEVYARVDQVRARAGLAGVVTSWANYSINPAKPSTKEGMRDIIQQERNIELAFEGQRYWDLRRWKKAEEEMNDPIRGWSIEEATPTGYYRVKELAYQRFTKRDYLWPLKSIDLAINNKLVQNPGW